MPAVRLAPVQDSKRSNVPEVRDGAVRVKGMSRRRGSRSGVSTRVVNDVAGRLRDIRALWHAVHNDPHKTVEQLAAEFYFAVGDVLEGRPLSALTLHKIDRARVDAHAEE
jgi:hypothetical protein